MKPRDIVFYVTLALLFVTGCVYALTFAKNDLDLAAGGAPDLEAIGILVAAGFTIALYSFLYHDNPFFKAAEHIYVGVGLGYYIVAIVWFQILKPDLYNGLVKYWVRHGWLGEEATKPNYLLVVPLVFSLLLLSRFIPKIAWLSRWSFALIVGFGAGISIPATIKAILLTQVNETIVPLDLAAGVGPLVGAIIVLAGVIATLIYFFFSVEHRGVVGAISKVGIWFLMISFGASFGYTVMGRMALLTQRIEFLLGTWLRIPL